MYMSISVEPNLPVLSIILSTSTVLVPSRPPLPVPVLVQYKFTLRYRTISTVTYRTPSLSHYDISGRTLLHTSNRMGNTGTGTLRVLVQVHHTCTGTCTGSDYRHTEGCRRTSIYRYLPAYPSRLQVYHTRLGVQVATYYTGIYSYIVGDGMISRAK